MQRIEIESFSNPRYKYLKSLQKSRNRKKEGVFIMEGRPELDLAFKSGLELELIAYSEAYISETEVIQVAGTERVLLLKLKKELFDELTYQNVPNNFIAVFKAFRCNLDELLAEEGIIVLDGIQKPGNLGAVLRTCDALGIKNIICTDSEIDVFNPNVLRNSRGALFSVKVVTCTTQKAQSYLSVHDYEVYAAALTDQVVDFRSVKTNTNASIAVVFGAESEGLGEQWLDFSDQHIIIPMRGMVDSLNLSVSVAIISSHFFSPIPH